MTAAIIILSPQIFLIFFNVLKSQHTIPSALNMYHRPFEDLFSQSAKVFSYLFPPVVHPIFGKFTMQFIDSPLYGLNFTEHTLYLGWIPLILAFIAVRQLTIRRKEPEESVDNFYIKFFFILAVVAWFFSQAPWWKIGPIKIYMPSFFMYKMLPMFRAYSRFGIVVMLAVAILSGFGLKSILEKIKDRRNKVILTIFLSIGVFFEFWNYPPFKII